MIQIYHLSLKALSISNYIFFKKLFAQNVYLLILVYKYTLVKFVKLKNFSIIKKARLVKLLIFYHNILKQNKYKYLLR